MITVIAHYRVKPGSADEVAARLAVHRMTTEAEPGCRVFAVHRDLDDPTRFALYEQYDDDAAFASHRASDHFHANIEQGVAPFLVERDWRRYGEVVMPGRGVQAVAPGGATPRRAHR